MLVLIQMLNILCNIFLETADNVSLDTNAKYSLQHIPRDCR